MASDDQKNSDPLPYTQVDRAVKPKATLLARMIGESPQHALGSLVEFWDLNGDPRELEELLAKGKREIVLPRAEVIGRFEAASGHVLEPAKLVSLGLLEPRGEDQYRVRGMSRYFEPVERRLQARRAAVAGGKARAASGRGKDGRFGPVSSAGAPAGGPAGGSGGSLAGGSAGEALERGPATHRPQTTTAGIAQRAEASGISGSLRAGRAGPGLREPDSRHAPLVKQLCETFRKETGALYPFAAAAGRNAAAVTGLLASGYEPPANNAASVRALHSKYPAVRTFSELLTNFPHFIGEAAPTKPGAPLEATRGEGPITARVLIP